MFGSIYTGLTGMMAFSQGLDVISNNVANLNTPGYKGNDLLFQDIFYRYGLSSDSNANYPSSEIGNGVTGDRTLMREAQGEIRETGNQNDVAIDGNGLFILRDGEDIYYTRAGQFEIDDDGYLVDRVNQARVAGFEDGELVDINVSELGNNRPRATTEIILTNNLSINGVEHEIPEVEVFDALGGSHLIDLKFINDGDLWRVEITDDAENMIASDGEIRFRTDGSPEEGFNRFSFQLAPDDVPATEILLNFGEAGSFTGATSFAAGETSDLVVESQDGYARGALIRMGFDRDGTLTVEYSNGKDNESTQLALAWFDDMQALRQIGGGLFLAGEELEPMIDTPMQGVMGEIVEGSLELSNVELTLEFTDLIIMQRGFQGSSQILTVSNEMIQQLLDIGRGGR
ncbi:flagellar basal-body rod protein FlgF [Candidatus Thiodiazotropha sp. CDECU1]|uniref:flagellar basal-body rod protein FlgF n=1 Tax=Candidatus Thiodiazotropha sp. CDECU1 TaxID=3065865 RepID=UPI002930CB61|nr:flagellar basal-body rod protein FlgF [Candidatus Thiodiazotropha sp. CDECU1]